jgi:hypothetical protein
MRLSGNTRNADSGRSFADVPCPEVHDTFSLRCRLLLTASVAPTTKPTPSRRDLKRLQLSQPPVELVPTRENAAHHALGSLMASPDWSTVPPQSGRSPAAAGGGRGSPFICHDLTTFSSSARSASGCAEGADGGVPTSLTREGHSRDDAQAYADVVRPLAPTKQEGRCAAGC